MQRSILYQGLPLFYANYFTKVVMNTPVRVINCGSSSIKYALIDSDPQAPRLAGIAERLGSSEARLKGKNGAGSCQI